MIDEVIRNGGAAPDGWPNDDKTKDQIRRIWSGEAGDNPPGSELPATATSLLASFPTWPDGRRLSAAEVERYRTTLAISDILPEDEFYGVTEGAGGCNEMAARDNLTRKTSITWTEVLRTRFSSRP
jgi:hypothetical protein